MASAPLSPSGSGSLRRTLRDHEPSKDNYRTSHGRDSELLNDWRARHQVRPSETSQHTSMHQQSPPQSAATLREEDVGMTQLNNTAPPLNTLHTITSQQSTGNRSGHYFNDGPVDLSDLGFPNKHRPDMQDGPRSASHARSTSRGARFIDYVHPASGITHIDQMTPAQQRRLRYKNHLLAMIGEYTGTTLFLMFAFLGTQIASLPSTSISGNTTTNDSQNAGTTVTVASANTSSLQFIALSFGMSLAVVAWGFFRISGGLFNPAVAFSLALAGVITPVRAVLLTVAELLGGITAAAIVQALIPGPQYVATRLQADMSVTRGLFLEMFLTAVLVFTILMLACEKSKTTFLAPVGIGLALFIAELGGVYWTGGSLNPARTLGPDVVGRQFFGYCWLYYAGPLMGGALAVGFYKLMRVLHYETVVPGQDDDGSAGLLARADDTSGPAQTTAIKASDNNANMGADDAREKVNMQKVALQADGGNAIVDDKNTGNGDRQNMAASKPTLSSRPTRPGISRPGTTTGQRSFLGINLGGANQSYALDRVEGPGISDYSRPTNGNLGADLDSAAEPTKYKRGSISM